MNCLFQIDSISGVSIIDLLCLKKKPAKINSRGRSEKDLFSFRKNIWKAFMAPTESDEYVTFTKQALATFFRGQIRVI